MLSDELLQKRCVRYIRRRVELADHEMRRLKGDALKPVAELYYRRFADLLEQYGDRPGYAVLDGYKGLNQRGVIELFTTAATHALLPLLHNDEAVHAQVEQGCRTFERHFGSRPKGFWLPECAYARGLEDILNRSGIEYFFLESHGMLLAEPRPEKGVFAPLSLPNGLVAFGRDVESSRQVWSGTEGYPGDPDYREFYRDLGFDADYDYIRPFLNAGGARHHTGIKYHRVSGDMPLEQKEAYDPHAARRKAVEHARHFVNQRCNQVERVGEVISDRPLIVSPYDAELFGHWWFEGPWFLDAVFREIAACGGRIRPTTPSGYRAENDNLQSATPAASTWGYEGYYELWVKDANDWIYPRLERAERAMVLLANRFGGALGWRKRVLRQCARELMLAQSSDWPFLLGVGEAAEYAERRVRDHIERFWQLCNSIEVGKVNDELLNGLEASDNIFPDIDYRLFAGDGK
jgi:1,4-alpha-glucan branching enzyme